MNKKTIGLIITAICGLILGFLLFEYNYATTKPKDEPTKEVDNTQSNDDSDKDEIVKNNDVVFTNKNQSVIELDSDITPKELFELEDNIYFIFFYRDNCFGCEFIHKYLDNVDLSTTPEIYRYNCTNINDDSNIFFLENEDTAFNGYKAKVEDLKKEEKLGIVGTPTMIKVSTDNNGERIATFSLGGGNICNKLDDYTKVTYFDFEQQLKQLEEESQNDEGSAVIDPEN